MADGKLGAVESRFADLVWENAPLASRELAKICEAALGWKRTTTYNVLRKLCDRGLFENDGGIVKAKLSREAFYCSQGEALVDAAFGGSLPAFLAAFTKRRSLKPEEIAEIQRMIEKAGERDG